MVKNPIPTILEIRKAVDNVVRVCGYPDRPDGDEVAEFKKEMQGLLDQL